MQDGKRGEPPLENPAKWNDPTLNEEMARQVEKQWAEKEPPEQSEEAA